jgi:hypothetical protein
MTQELARGTACHARNARDAARSAADRGHTVVTVNRVVTGWSPGGHRVRGKDHGRAIAHERFGEFGKSIKFALGEVHGDACVFAIDECL